MPVRFVGVYGPAQEARGVVYTAVLDKDSKRWRWFSSTVFRVSERALDGKSLVLFRDEELAARNLASFGYSSSWGLNGLWVTPEHLQILYPREMPDEVKVLAMQIALTQY